MKGFVWGSSKFVHVPTETVQCVILTIVVIIIIIPVIPSANLPCYKMNPLNCTTPCKWKSLNPSSSPFTSTSSPSNPSSPSSSIHLSITPDWGEIISNTGRHCLSSGANSSTWASFGFFEGEGESRKEAQSLRAKPRCPCFEDAKPSFLFVYISLGCAVASGNKAPLENNGIRNLFSR